MVLSRPIGFFLKPLLDKSVRPRATMYLHKHNGIGNALVLIGFSLSSFRMNINACMTYVYPLY